MNILQKLCLKNRHINYLVNYAEVRLGKTFLNSFPQEVGIGVTNICNANCTFCLRDWIKPKKHLDFETVKKILSPIIKILDTVGLEGNGEPLLNPEFFKIFEYITSNNVNTYLITNGILLTPENNRMLVERGLGSVNISLNAFKRETYKSIMGVDAFDTVCKNIEHLVKLKNDFKGGKLQISLSFILTSKNYTEIDDFISFAEKLEVHKVYIHSLTPLRLYRQELFASVSSKKIEVYKDLFLSKKIIADFLPALEIRIKKSRMSIGFNRDDYNRTNILETRQEATFFDQEKQKKIWCEKPWIQYNNYFTNGAIHPCCFLTTSQYLAGNVNENSFQEIWNSDFYKKLRKLIVTQNYFPECKFCNTKVSRDSTMFRKRLISLVYQIFWNKKLK